MGAAAVAAEGAEVEAALAEAVAEVATAEAAAEAARAGVEAATAEANGRPWQLALMRRPGSAFAGLVGDTLEGAQERGVGSI